jgi:hypothetical protein
MRLLDRRATAFALALALIAARAPGRAAEPEATSEAGAAPEAGAAEPLARRWCEVMHALPAERKGECCGTTPGSLAEPCTGALGAALRRGALSIDAAALERCAAEASRELEGCGWVGPRPPKPPSACTTLIEGKLESGGSCRSSLECLDGLYCRGATAEGVGVCAAPATPGGRCAAPADNLAAFSGLRDDPRHPECRGLCIKGQCLAFAGAGGACPSSAICGHGLRCIAGRCQEPPRRKIGESCEGHAACDEGTYCSAGRCAPVKGGGETCSLPAECGGLACERSRNADTGTCADPCGPGGSLKDRRKP